MRKLTEAQMLALVNVRQHRSTGTARVSTVDALIRRGLIELRSEGVHVLTESGIEVVGPRNLDDFDAQSIEEAAASNADAPADSTAVAELIGIDMSGRSADIPCAIFSQPDHGRGLCVTCGYDTASHTRRDERIAQKVEFHQHAIRFEGSRSWYNVLGSAPATNARHLTSLWVQRLNEDGTPFGGPLEWHIEPGDDLTTKPSASFSYDELTPESACCSLWSRGIDCMCADATELSGFETEGPSTDEIAEELAELDAARAEDRPKNFRELQAMVAGRTPVLTPEGQPKFAEVVTRKIAAQLVVASPPFQQTPKTHTLRLFDRQRSHSVIVLGSTSDHSESALWFERPGGVIDFAYGHDLLDGDRWVAQCRHAYNIADTCPGCDAESELPDDATADRILSDIAELERLHTPRCLELDDPSKCVVLHGLANCRADVLFDEAEAHAIHRTVRRAQELLGKHGAVMIERRADGATLAQSIGREHITRIENR